VFCHVYRTRRQILTKILDCVVRAQGG